jgi:hypothetical protein
MANVYFRDRVGNITYISGNFHELKNSQKWVEVGIEQNGKKYVIDLQNGKVNLNGEWVEIGKDINGYFEKFSDRNLEYGKNLIYYCESYPMGMSGQLQARKIYLGYECDLGDLKINYNLYTVKKYGVLLVYDCEKYQIGMSVNTETEFHINGKNIPVKI